jgi:hypothetical protein
MAVASFEILYLKLSGETEESHEIVSGQLAPGPKFEPETSRV